MSVFFLLLGFNAELIKPQGDCATPPRRSCWSYPLKGNSQALWEAPPGEPDQKGRCCFVRGLGACKVSPGASRLSRVCTTAILLLFLLTSDQTGLALYMLAEPFLEGFEGEKLPDLSCEPTAGGWQHFNPSQEGMQLKQRENNTQAKRLPLQRHVLSCKCAF